MRKIFSSLSSTFGPAPDGAGAEPGLPEFLSQQEEPPSGANDSNSRSRAGASMLRGSSSQQAIETPTSTSRVQQDHPRSYQPAQPATPTFSPLGKNENDYAIDPPSPTFPFSFSPDGPTGTTSNFTPSPYNKSSLSLLQKHNHGGTFAEELRAKLFTTPAGHEELQRSPPSTSSSILEQSTTAIAVLRSRDNSYQMEMVSSPSLRASMLQMSRSGDTDYSTSKGLLKGSTGRGAGGTHGSSSKHKDQSQSVYDVAQGQVSSSTSHDIFHALSATSSACSPAAHNRFYHLHTPEKKKKHSSGPRCSTTTSNANQQIFSAVVSSRAIPKPLEFDDISGSDHTYRSSKKSKSSLWELQSSFGGGRTNSSSFTNKNYNIGDEEGDVETYEMSKLVSPEHNKSSSSQQAIFADELRAKLLLSAPEAFDKFHNFQRSEPSSELEQSTIAIAKLRSLESCEKIAKMKSPTLSSSTLRKQSLLSGTTDTTTEQPSASNSFFGTSALTNSKEITTSDQHNNLQNSNYAQPFVNDPSLDYVRNSRVVEPLTPDAVGLVKKDQNYIPLSAIVMHRPIPKPLEFDDASSDHTYRSSAAASSNRFLLPREKNTDAFCSTYQHDVEAPVREDPQWRERSRHLSQKVVQSESEDVASIRVAAATSGADEEAATDNFSVAFSGAESRQRNISYNSNGVNQQVAGDHGQASKRDEHLRKISENENTHTFCGLPVPSMHDWD